jgi:hypothetical protein
VVPQRSGGYAISDYWTGEQHEIECPTENRRVLKLYLPFGRHRFRSRYAYRLGYVVQREDACGKAQRRARNLPAAWR